MEPLALIAAIPNQLLIEALAFYGKLLPHRQIIIVHIVPPFKVVYGNGIPPRNGIQRISGFNDMGLEGRVSVSDCVTLSIIGIPLLIRTTVSRLDYCGIESIQLITLN